MGGERGLVQVCYRLSRFYTCIIIKSNRYDIYFRKFIFLDLAYDICIFRKTCFYGLLKVIDLYKINYQTLSVLCFVLILDVNKK